MNKVNYENLVKGLETDEQADFEFQQRRHDQWKENYQLYRDTVIVNRLTQRQSVNIPLMKGSIKTILSNIDEFPGIEFEELGNNKDKEIFFNTYWDDTVIKDKMELKDIIDKKQEQLYGKTWRMLNIRYGRFESDLLEPYDVLVDRFSDPTDLESNHHIILPNIFRTLDQLEANPLYDKGAVKRLRAFYATRNGLIKAEQTTQLLQAKNQRLSEMGVPDLDNPIIGHTVVQVKMNLVKVWDLTDQQQHIHAIMTCGNEILMAKSLLELLNIDFYPLVTWSSDPERNDHYPDGTADIVRTPNKVLNVWFSQLTENRTLRNMGMNFYDATANENWVPQSFEAIPFGWYPLPGKPDEVYKKVDIPDLSESLDEMEYLKGIIESATAATATTKGDTEKGKVTLGEVELTLQAAKERIGSTTKFSTLAQKEFGDKWAKMVNANPDKLDAVKLYKKSYKGNWFEKTVTPNHWKSEAGYLCKVVSSSEREQKGLQTIQKLRAIKQDFPVNIPLIRIVQKRELEFADLNPDEIKEVMDYEDQNVGVPPQAVPGQESPGGAVPKLTPETNAQPVA